MNLKFLHPGYRGIIQTPEVMQMGCSYAEQSSEEHTNVLTPHFIPV